MLTPSQAAALLLEGRVVALPTETVYGLAALPSQEQALFSMKGRSEDKRFVIAISSLEMMTPFSPRIPDSFHALAKKYWPGPLTLILPTKEGTLGFRMPDHPLTLQVLNQTGPLLLTSANLAGEPPATTASEITLDVPILDGGPAREGIASTILLFDGEWKVVRQGKLLPKI